MDKLSARPFDQPETSISGSMAAEPPVAQKTNSMIAVEVAQETANEQSASGSGGGRKRDYFSSLMSTAGSKMMNVVAKAQSVQPNLSDSEQQTVIQVLKGENIQLKDLVTEQQEKVEDLQDAIEVHKSLEEEAHEDNEELKYRVKYLEELARENGHDISSLKQIQDLGTEKKSLQSQVNQLQRQIR